MDMILKRRDLAKHVIYSIHIVMTNYVLVILRDEYS